MALPDILTSPSMRTVQFGLCFVASPLGDDNFSGTIPARSPVNKPVPPRLLELFSNFLVQKKLKFANDLALG